MKPYAIRALSHEKRIFNYRLSRARRIVENAFGILANRFQIFLSTMKIAPENVEKITLASCALHNYLREKSPLKYTPPGTFDTENLEDGCLYDGDWREDLRDGGMRSIRVNGSNNYRADAKEIREQFCKYFNTVGAVEWQERFI